MIGLTDPSAAQRYAASVLTMACAAGLQYLYDIYIGPGTPFILLYPAILISGWYGGFGPGLLAAALGALAAARIFVLPDQTDRLFRFAIFSATAILAAALSESLHRVWRQATQMAETLRVTLASIGDGVITTDTEGRITLLNARGESITGWKQLDATGQPLEVVFHIVNEQTRKPSENPARRALQAGSTIGVGNHTILIRKDGAERSIEENAAAIQTAQGHVAGSVLIFRDITERRALETDNAERLSACHFLASIVESSNDAIISKSLDGIIHSWNAAAERLLGYTAEQAIGRHISFIIPPDRASEEEAIIARLRRGELVEHFDTVRMRSDGRPISVSLTISPIRDEAGRVVGASKIMRDVTERNEAERRTQELMAELTEAHRRKDEFLAMLGHELRNPLSAVRNAVATASLDAARRPRALEIARRQADQLARLIDDLLDVARITRGRIMLRREHVDLGQIVQRAVESTRLCLDTRGLRLALTLTPEPIIVDVDPARLEQVFVNVLSNATKYSDTGGQVEVVTERRGDTAAVSIRDTGIGIAPEMLPHIWDLFAQAERGLDRAQGGLGIGLTVAQQLIALHGGRIEAHSEGLGKGAEFVIILPMPPATRKEDRTVVPAKSAESTPTRHARILVVEDNPDTAASLTMLLEFLGHQVRVLRDGISALDAARANVPDVMLVDIGLPGIDGYEVARRVRQDPDLDHVVMVALTGYGREEDKRQAMAAGFDFHLVKPVNPDTLNGVVVGLGRNELTKPPTVH